MYGDNDIFLCLKILIFEKLKEWFKMKKKLLQKVQMSKSSPLTLPSFLVEIRLNSYILLENMFVSVVF